jgi:Peptidase M15
MAFVPGNWTLSDVFHSSDVNVNGVPVALWKPPQGGGGFGGAAVAAGSKIINGTLNYTNTPDGIASAIASQDAVSPNLSQYHEDVAGQTTGPGGTSPVDQNAPIPTAATPGECVNSKYYKLSDSHMPIEAQMGLTQAQIECNFIAICTNILDPLRDAGINFNINSAFRTLAYNRSIGSSDTSDHTIGCAVDLSIGSAADNIKLFKALLNNYPYSQLIFEGKWVHVAYNGHGPKGGAKIMYTYTGSSPITAGATGQFLPADLKA